MSQKFSHLTPPISCLH